MAAGIQDVVSSRNQHFSELESYLVENTDSSTGIVNPNALERSLFWLHKKVSSDPNDVKNLQATFDLFFLILNLNKKDVAKQTRDYDRRIWEVRGAITEENIRHVALEDERRELRLQTTQWKDTLSAREGVVCEMVSQREKLQQEMVAQQNKIEKIKQTKEEKKRKHSQLMVERRGLSDKIKSNEKVNEKEERRLAAYREKSDVHDAKVIRFRSNMNRLLKVGAMPISWVTYFYANMPSVQRAVLAHYSLKSVKNWHDFVDQKIPCYASSENFLESSADELVVILEKAIEQHEKRLESLSQSHLVIL